MENMQPIEGDKEEIFEEKPVDSMDIIDAAPPEVSSAVPVTSAASSVVKKFLNKKNITLLVGIILGMVVIGGGVAAGFTWWSVKHLSQNSIVLKSARLLHLPVAKINGHYISYSDYVGDLVAMQKFYEKNKDQMPAPLTPETMSDNVIAALIYNQLAEQFSQERGISVSDEDLQKVRQQLMSNFGNEEAVSTALAENYGWTLAQFENRVIKPGVATQKLAEDIVKAKAQSVLDRVKAGEDFVTLAKEFGEDATKDKGGDLGWFAQGAMVPEFEAAAFAATPSTTAVLPELVKTQYGFHIVQVLAERTNKDKAKEVHARHILFTLSQTSGEFKKFMDEKLKAMDLKIYLPIHNPFADLLKTDSATTTTQQ